LRRLAGVGIAAALLLGVAGWGLAAQPAALDTRQQAYRGALVGARDSLDPTRAGDPALAVRALDILRLQAPGEIDAIHMLRAQPPQTVAARGRLDSSIAAMARAARDPDPAASQARLREILAQSHYHPDQGPLAFVGSLLVRLLQALLSPGAGIFGWLVLLLLVGLLALIVVLLVPALRGPLRRSRNGAVSSVDGPAAVPPYFRTADTLAAKGDHAGAVRALVAGTMEMISGERSFTASPLTVRETFNRSPGASFLRPLLLGFERSYYGHHETTPEEYQAAAASAHRYREMAAAARVAA
jgi:hypothetical protein